MVKMESLPPEILSHVLSFLDSEPPFPQLICEYPNQIADSKSGIPTGPLFKADLHTASKVSRTWRRICFPLLFSHIKWNLQPKSNVDIGGGRPEQSLLDFLRSQQGERMFHIVESITILAFENIWGCDVFEPPDYILQRTKDLWISIFTIVDPVRVTFIGDPCVIAILTGLAPIPGANTWMFELSKQVLQLTRPSRSKREPLVSNTPTGSDLLSLRPWTNLLLNEGSFLDNYATYEYHEHLPPSLLRKIFMPPSLQQRSATRLPHLESFSYICIFPTGPHFARTVIPYFPGVETLYLQIAPRDFDFSWILDRSLLGRLDMKDPWMESHNVGMEIKAALFDKDHPHAERWDRVRRFETPRKYSRDLHETVSEGVLEEFLDDVNYRKWTVRQEPQKDVLVRGDT